MPILNLWRDEAKLPARSEGTRGDTRNALILWVPRHFPKSAAAALARS